MHNFTIIVFGFLFFSATTSINASEHYTHQATDQQEMIYQATFNFERANPLIFQFLRANLAFVNSEQWQDFLGKLPECKTVQDRMQLRNAMRQAVVDQVKPEIVCSCVATLNGICSGERWDQELKKLPTDQDREDVEQIRKEYKDFVKPMLQKDHKA